MQDVIEAGSVSKVDSFRSTPTAPSRRDCRMLRSSTPRSPWSSFAQSKRLANSRLCAPLPKRSSTPLSPFSPVTAREVRSEIVQAVKREEESRGLNFKYCLCNVGQSFNRAPSDQVWRDGDVLALNSGGNYNGYIGDLCRMGVLGRPDSELEDLLAEVDNSAGREKADPSRSEGWRHLRRARHADRLVTAPPALGLRCPRDGHRQPRSAVAHR